MAEGSRLFVSPCSAVVVTFGNTYAPGQSVADTLKMYGGIAGLMIVCESDSSGWEKIEQFLAKANSTAFRSYLQESASKAQLENLVDINGQEMKFTCEELKSSGRLAKLKGVLFTNMDALINAP